MLADDGPPLQRSVAHEVLRSAGKPLDEPVRNEMEARLGADFSDVRLHTDGTARRSAAELGARAWTSGSHVVLGEGGADRHTLAHELTHVIQQRRGPVAGTDNGSGLSLSDPSDHFEREAEANATRALSGPVPVGPEQGGDVRAGGSPEAVQRTVVAYSTSDKGADEKVMEDLAAFAKKLDAAVRLAWLQATQNPTDPKVSETDGHTKLWAQEWQAYEEGRVTPQDMAGMLPSRVGYAIESLGTKVFLKLGKEWAGSASGHTFSVLLQATDGNTRPDVVLSHGKKAVGWYDITSENSKGHITGKDGPGWANKPYVAEITYPAVSLETVTSHTDKWEKAGRPAIADDPMVFADYWLERASFELTMDRMRKDIAGASPSLLDHARKAADGVTGGANQNTRRQYMGHCLALYKRGTLSGTSEESTVAAELKDAFEKGATDAFKPQPKDVASIIQWLTGDSKKYGFQGTDGKGTYKSLSVQPGISWLQDCAAYKQFTVPDADVRAYIETTYPDGRQALSEAGLT
ncbi:DUF4157 domain-containing protein [Streptomyces sp. HNM0574]|uniref:eCIS core domain-containing protein n=1 Tax=Streptomyces sp. HNM0574 TaxID=2714954 RepID=UPI00146B6342|nr:DUF4157 domain-containing protein [Streptomyces sp. HNM0574]NLU70563.1 DUF4157 domain-containing protein [Streptomyces sp. HNM0574]